MKKILFGIIVLILFIFLIILIPSLMVMDFFGANITDGYIENNIEYSDNYIKTLNNNISNGYVSLERILYFYLADNSLSFDEIYKDNIDLETKKLIPISEVCQLNKYKVLNVCKNEYLSNSNQIDVIQNKPFSPPIDFSLVKITSFFMEERYIYDNYDIHNAWDLAAPNETPVYSVCDGIVETVNFPYSENEINTEDLQGGNIVRIKCDVDEIEYKILYAHLYPNSFKVEEGQSVSKGQIIAGVGQTGFSTNSHLHYQVSVNDKNIDGMSLIDFNYEFNDKNLELSYNF